jgi:hypothetical protein
MKTRIQRNNVAETPVGRNEMGYGHKIKNNLGQNILTKAAMGYAFSAVAPSHYSSDSLTIIDISYYSLKMAIFDPIIT